MPLNILQPFLNCCGEQVNVIFDVKPESYNCDVHMFLENAYIY